jgi:glycerate kinase
MRVLVAFDKFKDALTAHEACEVAARALHEKHPDWELDLCPLSDGGDGFEEVLGGSARGEFVPQEVTGPRGARVEAGFTLVSESQIPAAVRSQLKFSAQSNADCGLAIIEMATASGLALLPVSQRNPWQTTSRGTGQLIKAAAEQGARAILLGVGGSATHDLGLGALSALGLEFRNAAGTAIRPPLPASWEEIVAIEGAVAATIPPIYIACDVTNPLLGPSGAATVFAPQKGLHADELTGLEAASERMAQMLCTHCHQPLSLPDTAGAGAAGGTAFGLICAARAQLIPGFALVAAWLGLDARLAAADLVLTGEGRFDATSLGGKGPGAILTRALTARKRVHLFAGQIGSPTAHDLLSLHEITPTDVPLERALKDTATSLHSALQRAL